MLSKHVFQLKIRPASQYETYQISQILGKESYPELRVLENLQFPGMAEQQQTHASSEQSNTDDFQTGCMSASGSSEQPGFSQTGHRVWLIQPYTQLAPVCSKSRLQTQTFLCHPVLIHTLCTVCVQHLAKQGYDKYIILSVTAWELILHSLQR